MLGKQHPFTPNLQLLPKSPYARREQVKPVGRIPTLSIHLLSIHPPQNYHLELITGGILPHLEWLMSQGGCIRYPAIRA